MTNLLDLFNCFGRPERRMILLHRHYGYRIEPGTGFDPEFYASDATTRLPKTLQADKMLRLN